MYICAMYNHNKKGIFKFTPRFKFTVMYCAFTETVKQKENRLVLHLDLP